MYAGRNASGAFASVLSLQLLSILAELCSKIFRFDHAQILCLYRDLCLAFHLRTHKEYSPSQFRDLRSSQRCFGGFGSPSIRRCHFWECFLTFKRSVLLPLLRVKDYLTLKPGGSRFLLNTEEPLSQRHNITSPKTWILGLKMYFYIFSCFFGFIIYLKENTVSIKKANILCKKVFK